MIVRTIDCAICGIKYTEVMEAEGFPGWGHLAGIELDGIPNPHLCPKHLAIVATFVDEMKQNDMD